MKQFYFFSSLVLVLVCTTSTQAALFDLETKLTADDAAADDWFGWSVAISGNTALVGARDDDDGGDSSGSAYLFDVTTGNQIAKLTAEDAAAGDRFGRSVAISGNTAIVGADGDDDAGSYSGSAYLFDVITGNQIAKLSAEDAEVGDGFGISVAISGDTAIVGAWLDDDAGNTSGSAYLFDVATSNQLAKLTAADAAEGDRFGTSVAINGNTALVGAYNDNEGAGSAYLFDVSTGNQLAKLTANDATANDFFGLSVAIRGNTVIVGASRDDDGGSDSGSAYLFDVTTGNQLAKLTASDAAADDRFGLSVAISGNTALVGASDSAYLIDVTTGNQLAKLTAADAAGGNAFFGSVSDQRQHGPCGGKGRRRRRHQFRRGVFV